VDGPRHQLLAGARFAGDQHVGRRAADPPDQLEDLLHGLRAADQVLQTIAAGHLGAQLDPARAAELGLALRDGRRVAVISEAGMPGVSDPGARAVEAAIAAGARVEVIPGPSAALAALLASGLPAHRFTFLGFPPREAGARRELFGTLRTELGAMIFYEAPDRVAATLGDLAAALGAARRASLGRELTKLHEEHVRGTLAELAARYAEAPPRGECTLVVEGGAAGAVDAAAALDVEAELRRLLDAGLGPRDAAARLVIVTGKPRRHLYQLALSLQRSRS
jgi:16S rRNA (cytidine1402-2'-O)-methyltransferase